MVKKSSPSKKKNRVISHGVGRRKRAVARVWLREKGSGQLTVNKKPYEDYFNTQTNRIRCQQPFVIVPDAKTYDVAVNVKGGGVCAQADAVAVGIARGLVKINESVRSILREYNLLTIDARKKERKKYGQKGARRKFQFTKR